VLSKEDNELITNTDRGTPMGEFFRRFWLPAALSEELPGPDCAPVRVKLLNEDLIAFRDTSGRPGLVDAYCPHRGAPMFFGRNEEDGLRCVYHGWKFDVTGACVDLPNAPEGETFKNKVRITGYPCEDKGGIIWAYMGPAEKKPPFPAFEWCSLPPANRYVTKFIMECNYLQAMEGDYDPSHGRFLHSTLDGNRNAIRQNFNRNQVRSTFNPQFFDSMEARRVKQQPPDRIEDSDSGILFITAQDTTDGRKSAQVAPWMMPIFTTAGITASTNTYSSNMRIPVDNHNILFYRLRWSFDPLPEEEIQEYKTGGYTHPEMIPGTWRGKANVHNDYEIDRVAQKYFTFTGIKTFPLQDIAMMENQWGSLADRTKEHLTSLDHRIIYVRRRLLRSAKNLAQGIDPSEPFHPEAYKYHSAQVVLESGTLDDAVTMAKQKMMESGARRQVVATAPSITA
jgi:phenylpropionate dioxygenase-like ring-hydroxylating dioxygenase large terminal subunit